MGSLSKITIRLDGRGVVLHPLEPLHVDGIISWAGEFRRPPGTLPSRTDAIEELPLPLRSEKVNGTKVYRASALFPVEAVEDSRHYRKRFRMEHALRYCADATINQSTGPFRSYNNRLNVVVTEALIGWFDGDRSDIRKWLRALKGVGHKRAHGYGRVVGIDIEASDEDRCLAWEGRATRFLPHPRGLKLVRPRPPYWNRTETVRCLVPGEPIPQ